MKVKSLSCVRLCDPMDCSLPGSSLHGVFQARILEWLPHLTLSKLVFNALEQRFLRLGLTGCL